jgi:hypothetical protein
MAMQMNDQPLDGAGCSIFRQTHIKMGLSTADGFWQVHYLIYPGVLWPTFEVVMGLSQHRRWAPFIWWPSNDRANEIFNHGIYGGSKVAEISTPIYMIARVYLYVGTGARNRRWFWLVLVHFVSLWLVVVYLIIVQCPFPSSCKQLCGAGESKSHRTKAFRKRWLCSSPGPLRLMPMFQPP